MGDIDMDRTLAKNLLIGIRVAFALGWVAPRPTGGLFGLDSDANPQGPYLGRLFAAREGLMAAQLLTAEDEELDRALTAQIAVDVADSAAALAAGTRGYITKRTMVMALLAAGAAAALGVLARSR
jgi:hypothetical protein